MLYDAKQQLIRELKLRTCMMRVQGPRVLTHWAFQSARACQKSHSHVPTFSTV